MASSVSGGTVVTLLPNCTEAYETVLSGDTLPAKIALVGSVTAVTPGTLPRLATASLMALVFASEVTVPEGAWNTT